MKKIDHTLQVLMNILFKANESLGISLTKEFNAEFLSKAAHNDIVIFWFMEELFSEVYKV
jgi:hypothetical protein